MKRRGFFGALTGLIAAPIAAKAVESMPEAPKVVEPEPEIVIQKRTRGPCTDDYATCISYVQYMNCTTHDWKT